MTGLRDDALLLPYTDEQCVSAHSFKGHLFSAHVVGDTAAFAQHLVESSILTEHAVIHPICCCAQCADIHLPLVCRSAGLPEDMISYWRLLTSWAEYEATFRVGVCGGGI